MASMWLPSLIKKLTLILLSGWLLAPASLLASEGGPGYGWFRRAYYLDNMAPVKAAAYYYRALSYGLKKKYKTITLWKLKAIHEARGEWDLAHGACQRILWVRWNKIAGNARGTHFRRIQKETGWPKGKVSQYLRGVRYLYLNPGRTILEWKKMAVGQKDKNPPDLYLRRQVDLALELERRARAKNQDHKPGWRLLNRWREKLPPHRFQEMLIYYLAKQEKPRLEILKNEAAGWLNRESQPEPGKSGISLARARVFYQMGKAFQNNDRFRRAYLLFRLAGNHPRYRTGSRWLAAYMLFSDGKDREAWREISRLPRPPEGFPAIFYHCLRYHLYKNQASRDYLRDHRKEVRAYQREMNNRLGKLARAYAGR